MIYRQAIYNMIGMLWNSAPFLLICALAGLNSSGSGFSIGLVIGVNALIKHNQAFPSQLVKRFFMRITFRQLSLEKLIKTLRSE